MDTKAILEKTIKDSQAVIDKAKADLEKLNVTYSVGQRFNRPASGQDYILAVNGEYKVILVNLSDGCVYSGAHQCLNSQAITQDEFKTMCIGSNFLLK